MNEGGVSDALRLEASRRGWRLWRNNVGAARDRSGRVIRYGLANDSAAMNSALKSSDLIGIRPLVITEEMVGTVVGQFVAVEVKSPGWKFRGTGREKAQKKFIDLVRGLGGHAYFSNSPEGLI